MWRGNQGFTLIEVLVALLILSGTLGLLLASLSTGLGRSGDTLTRQRIVSEMTSHLERIGTDLPVVAGESGGVYPSGSRWRLRIEPYLDAPMYDSAARARLFQVTLWADWPSPLGGEQKSVTTLKLVIPR